MHVTCFHTNGELPYSWRHYVNHIETTTVSEFTATLK